MENHIRDLPSKKSTLCGIKDREHIRTFVKNLEAMSHAIDEEDWDRLQRKEYAEALDEIEKIADIMTRAGCVCPPHGLFTPKEKMEQLRVYIKAKDVKAASDVIKDLLFALVAEI